MARRLAVNKMAKNTGNYVYHALGVKAVRDEFAGDLF